MSSRIPPIDLSPGGPEWAGFLLAPFGKARTYRLVTPDQEALTPAEIREIRAAQLDLSYLQSRARALEAEVKALRTGLSETEFSTIEAALAILMRQVEGYGEGRRRAR